MAFRSFDQLLNFRVRHSMGLQIIQRIQNIRKYRTPKRTILRELSVFVVLVSLFAIQAKLSPGQRRRKIAVPDEIVQQLMNDEYVRSRNYQAAQLARELQAEQIDLNNDGKPELIVQGFCSATGNCSTSIYRKTQDGYQELLSHDAQLVRVKPTVSNGYHDIVYDMHASASESWLFVYRFDGRRYHLKECFDSNYLGSHGRIARRPTVTRRKCESEK